MSKRRYLYQQTLNDLEEKMLFLGGPRQVGKTTLSKELLQNFNDSKIAGYMNWDDMSDRSKILNHELPNSKLWVFDEIHKYRKWRGFVKGLYDKNKDERKILVTGSARLDWYRFGGDSLQGRYHYLRLHPLSLKEIKGNTKNDLDQLLTLGGFPEPFFSGSEVKAKRWSKEYRSRLIQDDITKLETISDVGSLELLSLTLPDYVAAPLSINSLRKDLQLSHRTVAKWLDIFERNYHIFRLAPMMSSKIKAVKKEQKHYHWDWSLVSDKSKRFENLIASQLLKWVHFNEDTLGADIELRYFRDQEGREVDFVIVENRKPIRFIEVKLSDTVVSPHLLYLKRKFPQIRATQVVYEISKEFINKEGVEVVSAVTFLKELSV